MLRFLRKENFGNGKCQDEEVIKGTDLRTSPLI